MMSVLMDDPGAFSSKDGNLSRDQVDRGDIKPFWTEAAVIFNDINYKTKFFKDPYGHVTAADFCTEYSGHVTDSASLETQRWNPARKLLDVAMGMFKLSGGGDGAPVDISKLFIMSSNFWNFCNGQIFLYYIYIVLTTHGCLKIACSAMDKGHSAGSDKPPRLVSKPKPRGSDGGGAEGGGGGEGGEGTPIVIRQSEDQMACHKAKRVILEGEAMVATDTAMVSLMAKHKEATADLKEFEGEHDFVEGSFMHKAKKVRVATIEGNLAALMKS